jgi:hypothetical protein
MAVYSNGTSECPTECPPPEADLLGGGCIDFMCSNEPLPTFRNFGDKGVCYLIRIGGFRLASDAEAASGQGSLEVACDVIPCPPSNTPVNPTVSEELTLVGAQNTATTGASVKNRYITVSGGNPGLKQVLRVRVVNLPAPYDVWNGMDFWVDNVRELCENGGRASPPCPQEPNLPKDTFWAATLTCNLADALKRDWTTLDLPLHIYHQVIIPSRFGVKDAVYEVAFAEEGCVLDDDASYSDPPRVVTAPRWGDVLDACNKDPCSAPQGVTNIGDVTGILAKFQNLPGAPIKSRVDLVGLPGNEDKLDHIISIVDVTWDLDAFVGGQYGFDPCPCGRQDPCGVNCPPCPPGAVAMGDE